VRGSAAWLDATRDLLDARRRLRSLVGSARPPDGISHGDPYGIATQRAGRAPDGISHGDPSGIVIRRDSPPSGISAPRPRGGGLATTGLLFADEEDGNNRSADPRPLLFEEEEDGNSRFADPRSSGSVRVSAARRERVLALEEEVEALRGKVEVAARVAGAEAGQVRAVLVSFNSVTAMEKVRVGSVIVGLKGALQLLSNRSK